MAMVRWRNGLDPTRELERLQDEINGLFSGDRPTENTGLFDRPMSPAVDITEDADRFVVTCDLPGVDDKDVEVSIADNVLTIKGEKKTQEASGEAKVYRQESWTGSFQRTISLPTTVDAEKIDAEMRHGVLHVTLPKREEVKPRKIDVKVS